MFKIESYITPIIINYIDKYVKDFRPQNAQVRATFHLCGIANMCAIYIRRRRALKAV